MNTTPFANDSGMTLTETMVVLMILALIVSVTMGLIASRGAGFELERTRRNILLELQSVRGEARSSGEPQFIRLDADARVFVTSTGGRVNLPETVEARLVGSNVCGDAKITFYGHGGSSGGEIILSGANIERTIEIDWLLGQIVDP